MEQENQKYSKQLVTILEAVKEGKVNYKLAVEKVHSDHARTLLAKYSDERRQVCEDIRKKIADLGGTAPTEDEKANLLDRTMLNLTTAISNDAADDQAALNLCRSSDEKCLGTFDEVLQGGILETELKPFLMTQRYKISKAYYEIDKLYFDLFKTSPE